MSDEYISLKELKESTGAIREIVVPYLEKAGIEIRRFHNRKGLYIAAKDAEKAREAIRLRGEFAVNIDGTLEQQRVEIPEEVISDAVEIVAPRSHQEPAVAVAIDAGRVEITPEIRAILEDRTKTKKVPLAPILEQLRQEGKPEGPAVDFDALKEQPILIHPSNCAGPRGCLESDEALHLFRAEDLVEELRRRGWEVSCTKSI